MTNPVFTNSNFQQQMQPAQQSWYQSGPQQGQQAPQGGFYGDGQQGQFAQQGQYNQNGRLEDMYAAPAATPQDTGRVTMRDMVNITGLNLGLVVVMAAVGWFVPGLWIIGGIAGLVLGLVNAFKREVSPILVMGYSAAMGLFLGGISASYEAMFDGIVIQAVLGTLSVFAVVLALYSSGKFRPTPKMTKIFMAATLGYAVFCLLNLVLSWTGVLSNPWGMRAGWIGVAIGLLAVCLAAYSLVMSFSIAEQGVRNGAPKKFAWYVAFGLVADLIWLYIEILRILAILRSND